jgi:UDP-N-acetylglucosamine--N-acetylmuramyl-(pentapeptide) pyrophosphoryl-undecaprenol N-acetylglucosamine transferase
MKIIIGAGGTGGHIIPAIAVANALHIMNWDVLFIGNSNSMEERLVKQYAYTFLPIKVQKIYRKLTIEHIKFPFLFVHSLILCLICFVKEHPNAVFVTGGYVSAPVALAAIILRLPLYFQDGNSYPGLTTRVFGRRAKRIFVASEKATEYLKKELCLLTGNPLLGYNVLDKSTFDFDKLNLNPSNKTLFVIGGSQGSEIINQAISNSINRLLQLKINIIWQTGKNHIDKIKKEFGNLPGIFCFDFTDKMNDFYQIADIAISRAGALSIAELEEHKLPTIFIPLPTAAENHQLANALAQQEKNICIVLEQKNLSTETLLSSINSVLDNYALYKDSFNALTRINATQKVSETINDDITNGR